MPYSFEDNLLHVPRQVLTRCVHHFFALINAAAPPPPAGGRAVLRVLDSERRQEHCAAVGSHLLRRLSALQTKHDIIGDVRGAGLMLGVELVTDRATKVRKGGDW